MLLSFLFSCFSWPFPQCCTLSHKSAPWLRPACCKVRCISKLFGLAKKNPKPHFKFDRQTPIKTSRYQNNRFERFGALHKITALKQLLAVDNFAPTLTLKAKLSASIVVLLGSRLPPKPLNLPGWQTQPHHFFGSCVLWWLKDSKMKWMNKIRLMNGKHK